MLALTPLAYAGGINVSYNDSFGKAIRVIGQFFRGFDTRAIIYSYNDCGALVVTVIEYAFWIETGRSVTTFPCPVR